MTLSLSSPVTAPLGSLLRQWSVASQQQARRNAMLATNALLRRRVERDDVVQFLAARRGEPTSAPQPTEVSQVANHC